MLQFCRTYTNDKDLRFEADGNHPIIDGSVSKVKRVSASDDGMLLARKNLAIDEPWKKDKGDAKRKLLEEVDVILRARHYHVMDVMGAYFLERGHHTHFAFIMERADTNLDAYLRHMMPRKKINRLFPWFGCLIGVTTYIHKLGILHGDIKPSNILVKNERVLLADFGISKARLWRTYPTMLFQYGRTDYCAPEMENGDINGQPADIFSLGAVFLEMVIALSCPGEREPLESCLCSQHTRSYTASVERIPGFIDMLKSKLQLAWALKVLFHSRMMLHKQPCRRPLAHDLNLAWSSLKSSDNPLLPCTCHRLNTSPSIKLEL